MTTNLKCPLCDTKLPDLYWETETDLNIKSQPVLPPIKTVVTACQNCGFILTFDKNIKEKS